MMMLLAFLALFMPAAASADESACGIAHQSCRAQCEAEHGDRALARSGCVTRCGVELGLCEGQLLYQDGSRSIERDVKPWLDQQGDRLRQFHDGFTGRDPLPRSTPPDGRLPGSMDL